jgi:hypothetical protein
MAEGGLEWTLLNPTLWCFSRSGKMTLGVLSSSSKVCSSIMLQDGPWSMGVILFLTLSHHLGLALASLAARWSVTYRLWSAHRGGGGDEEIVSGTPSETLSTPPQPACVEVLEESPPVLHGVV